MNELGSGVTLGIILINSPCLNAKISTPVVSHRTHNCLPPVYKATSYFLVTAVIRASSYGETEIFQ